LQSCIDLADGVQRAVIHAFQHTRGLFFLGMLFQLAFAFFSDRLQIRFHSSKFVQVLFALPAQLLGEHIQ
jgi:hypothetical protein